MSTEQMAGLGDDLTAFVAEYQRANNSHDIDRVLPMIAEDATYWFSDGSYQGLGEIRGAIEQTFATIQEEVYEISNLEWLVVTGEHAVCRYRFTWRGIVEGHPSTGRGRGTNVIVRRDGTWKMRHEHLSN